eukprot:scaffold4.g4982.t1
MDRSNRTEEATTSSGPDDFDAWLAEHLQKPGQKGMHTREELEIIRQLLEADQRWQAAGKQGWAPAAEWEAIRPHYNKDAWSRYRRQFRLDAYGLLEKKRHDNQKGGGEWYPVCPAEEAHETLRRAHTLLSNHAKDEGLEKQRNGQAEDVVKHGLEGLPAPALKYYVNHCCPSCDMRQRKLKATLHQTIAIQTGRLRERMQARALRWQDAGQTGACVELDIDLFDMGQYQTADGYRYIFNVTDRWSRRAWLRPLRSKEPEEVAMHLRKIWLGDGAAQLYLQCDNGAEFKGAVKMLCEAWNVKQAHGPAYEPRPQGGIERQGCTVKEAPAKLFDERGTSAGWPELLEVVEWRHNCTPRRVLGGMCPFQVEMRTILHQPRDRNALLPDSEWQAYLDFVAPGSEEATAPAGTQGSGGALGSGGGEGSGSDVRPDAPTAAQQQQPLARAAAHATTAGRSTRRAAGTRMASLIAKEARGSSSTSPSPEPAPASAAQEDAASDEATSPARVPLALQGFLAVDLDMAAAQQRTSERINTPGDAIGGFVRATWCASASQPTCAALLIRQTCCAASSAAT